jgi:hypothetical protein
MQQLIPKDAWGIDDQLVINGKHGTIKEFSANKSKVYVQHRDNENQAYVRWYEATELPPYPGAGEPFLPPAAPEKPKFTAGQRVRLTRDLLEETTVHPVNLYAGDEGTVKAHPEDKGLLGFLSDRWGDITSFNKKIDGVTQSVLNFCELIETPSPTAVVETPAIVTALPDDLPNDVELLKQMIRKQRVQLTNQAESINKMMSDADDELQDKFDQLTEDYETQAVKLTSVSVERDSLKLVNEQQAKLLRDAADLMNALRVVGKFFGASDNGYSAKLVADGPQS